MPPTVVLKMAKAKTCSCCQSVHTVVPQGARQGSDEMFYWECGGVLVENGERTVCRSTLGYAPTYTAIAMALAKRRGHAEPPRPELVKSRVVPV